MKGSYMTGFYLLQVGIDTSYQGLTSVGGPEWPSMRYPTNDLTTENISGAPTPEHTPNDETIDSLMADLSCTHDPTEAKAQRQVIAVDNVGGNAYSKATGMYNKHRKFSEQWNSLHHFLSAHNFPQAQCLSLQMKLLIDRYLRRGLHKFKIESFQSADGLQ